MRGSDRYRFFALGVALCAALAACYRYTAVPLTGASVGERVRVRVSGAQAERLEPVLGIADREIEGQLLEQQDSSIALSVAVPMPVEGSGAAERAHQRILIPRADLQEVELRQLDKTRTSLLVGAGVVAVTAAIAASTGAIELGSSGSRGNPTKNRVPPLIPLLQWSFRFP